MKTKNSSTAYALCIGGGYLGLHLFYIGKYPMAILYLLTCGLFGIGWISDLCAIDNGTFYPDLLVYDNENRAAMESTNESMRIYVTLKVMRGLFNALNSKKD